MTIELKPKDLQRETSHSTLDKTTVFKQKLLKCANHKYLLLSYSGLNPSFNPLAIKNSVNLHEGRCTIIQEIDRTNTTHYHAFCLFDKHLCTRNNKLFNLRIGHQTYQPTWKTIEGAPWIAWKYMHWKHKDHNTVIVVDDCPEPTQHIGHGQTNYFDPTKIKRYTNSVASNSSSTEKVEPIEATASNISETLDTRSEERRVGKECRSRW